ncbi:MAG: hypothetical protein QM784_35770 [Polyangiaceae bacterium]
MTLPSTILRCLSVTSLAAVLACSSDKGGGHCGSLDACGGDVTGTWQVTSSCVEGDLKSAANLSQSLPPACRGNYDQVNANVSGTVAFANGVATDDTITTVDYTVHVPVACMAAIGITSTDLATACAGVGAAIVAGGYHQEVTCSVQGSTCSCAAKDTFTRDGALSYTVSGSKLSYTASNDQMDFCVDGTTLRARQFATELLTTVFFEATKVN